jgi:hypothetical protein
MTGTRTAGRLDEANFPGSYRASIARTAIDIRLWAGIFARNAPAGEEKDRAAGWRYDRAGSLRHRR